MANDASLAYEGSMLGDVLSKVIEENDVNPSQILRKTTLLILTDTVKNTRVDTGALRNNWQVSRNLRMKNEVKGADKNGSQTISKGRRVVSRIKANDIVYLTNNLPYAEEYERKDKMLKNAIRKVTRNLEKAIRS